MNKKIYYLLGTVFLILAASLFIDFSYLGRKITNGLYRLGLLNDFDEEAVIQNKEAINDIYKTSFRFSQYQEDECATYIPQYDGNTAEQAVQYAELFDMPADKYIDDETAYIYKNENIELSVYKYINLLHYENTSAEKADPQKKLASNQEAINAALEFLQNHGLSLKYSETVVNFENNTYMITFADKLSGIVNYAFPTSVTVDGAGEVVAMDYYYFSYERLSRCRLKTMKQAFYELPVDFSEGTKIDLNRCTLVYEYENSILQPAYLFEGELQGGGTFRCFVNAAVYK